MTYGVTRSWLTEWEIKDNLKQREIEERERRNHAHKNILLLSEIRDILTYDQNYNLTLEDFNDLVNKHHPKEQER